MKINRIKELALVTDSAQQLISGNGLVTGHVKCTNGWCTHSGNCRLFSTCSNSSQTDKTREYLPNIFVTDSMGIYCGNFYENN